MASGNILKYAKVHQYVDVFLIQDETHLWLSCQETIGDRFGVFWSTPRDPNSSTTQEDIIGQLKERLANLSPERNNLLELLQFWPRGWEFWGIGLPERIADYYCGDEFRIAAERLRAG